MKVVTAYTNRLGNRNNNQDRCLAVIRNNRALLAVADGMGGHARGELAAQAAVDSLRRAFVQHHERIADPSAFLKSALESAHLDVVDAGRREHPPVDPRTTCVVCLVQDDQAWWAHVGDSRLYLLRGGSMVARTRDHTPVEELLQRGAIDEEQLRTHPMRNSVSRCLGGAPRLPLISLDQSTLKPDDILLLCSDGFWSALAQEKLLSLPRYGDLERAVNQLADEAEMASYPQSDNISVVCLHWLSAERNEQHRAARGDKKGPPERADDASDPVKQAIDSIHRAMLDYAAEMKK